MFQQLIRYSCKAYWKEEKPGVEVITKDHDRLVIFYLPGKTIFAFAGSNDLKDWVNNFRINPMGIHAGFKESYKKFSKVIQKNIAFSHPDIDIIFTGHSRGGALATLAAMDTARHARVCECVVFGSPKVGDEKFKQEYDRLPIEHIGFRNGWDIVTYLPVIFGEHVGKIVRLKKPWYRRMMYFRVKDHMQRAYIKAIDKYVKNN